MDTIQRLISLITSNTDLIKTFGGKVVIYNRMLKANIEDICKAYGTDDKLLITYEMSKIEKNLDMCNTRNITLIFNVWSKKNQVEANNIEEILEEILESADGEGVELFELRGYENVDDTYYRTTLQTSFISF